MVSTCIVPGCKNSNTKCLEGVRYFCVPVKDQERCRLWLKTAKNHKYGEKVAMGDLKNLCVYSQHFKLDDYKTQCFRPNAVLSVAKHSRVQMRNLLP